MTQEATISSNLILKLKLTKVMELLPMIKVIIAAIPLMNQPTISTTQEVLDIIRNKAFRN